MAFSNCLTGSPLCLDVESTSKDNSAHRSMAFAPTSPHDKSKAAVCKTPKLLRFDLRPAFVCGDVPSSAAYSVSVKNTFLDSFEDSDCEPALPPRSASAPSMPILKNFASPTAAHAPATTPESQFQRATGVQEVAPYLQLPQQAMEASARLSDIAGVAVSRSRSPSTTPGIAMSRSHSSSSSLDSSYVSSHCSTTSRSSSSSLDSSVAFKVKNTFVHVDIDVHGEDDIGLPVKSVSQPDLSSVEESRYPGASEILTMQSEPAGASALPSVGSAGHSAGQCRPCAWFWKPQSCQWGSECKHCHLCPMGELRRRKKEMQAKAKELKRAAKALAQESCLEIEDAPLVKSAQ